MTPCPASVQLTGKDVYGLGEGLCQKVLFSEFSFVGRNVCFGLFARNAVYMYLHNVFGALEWLWGHPGGESLTVINISQDWAGCAIGLCFFSVLSHSLIHALQFLLVEICVDLTQMRPPLCWYLLLGNAETATELRGGVDLEKDRHLGTPGDDPQHRSQGLSVLLSTAAVDLELCWPRSGTVSMNKPGKFLARINQGKPSQVLSCISSPPER